MQAVWCQAKLVLSEAESVWSEASRLLRSAALAECLETLPFWIEAVATEVGYYW